MERMPLFAAMIDCSRNAVLKPETLRRLADTLQQFGYNAILLYTEDTYEIEGEPYFGYMRGRYTKKEIQEFDVYCQKKGLELIPCIQTLAHLNQMFQWHCYDEVHDSKDILLPKEEKTYALIEKMMKTARECFSSHRIHIGMDEADVGRGQYLDRNGYRPRKQIIAEHLAHVLKIAHQYDFEPMMWSDMFFGVVQAQIPSKEIRDRIPKDVEMVYWDYYSKSQEHYRKGIEANQSVPNQTAFAAGVWSWLGFAPANGYALRCLRPAMNVCREKGVKDILVTAWKDNGAECSLFSCLPAFYAAKKFYDGVSSMKDIQHSFEESTGERWSDFRLLDRLNLVGCSTERGPWNVAKWATYEDLLCHKFYSVVSPTQAKEYASLKRKLKNAAKRSPSYSYLFEEASLLADFLSLKYGLANRIYDAYQAQDHEKLSICISDIGKAEKKLSAFYASFQALWEKENKRSGFEIQDIRLGGLLTRLRHVISILENYQNGKIERIEELEDPRPLDPDCLASRDEKEGYGFYTYLGMISQNAM